MFKKLKQKMANQEAALRAEHPYTVHVQGGLRTPGGRAEQPAGSQFIHLNTDQFLQHLTVADE